MKIYKYDYQRYFFSIIIPAFLMLGILTYGILNNLRTLSLDIYSLCIIVSLYGLFNNVISLSNPRKIIDDGKEIKFFSFGRAHIYSWENVKYVRIKEFYGRKIYLRIDNPSLTKGRYWIKTAMYNDGYELYEKFKGLERKLHPNLLKFRSKRI